MTRKVGTLEDVMVDLSVSEGRLGMCVESEPATARLFRSDHELLSRIQPALRIGLSGDGFNTAVWLDTTDLEALGRAIDATLAGPTTDGGTEVELVDADGGRR